MLAISQLTLITLPLELRSFHATDAERMILPSPAGKKTPPPDV